MNGDGPRLTRRQEATILALLSSPSIRKAAAKVGAQEKTVRAWMDQPEFMKAYRAARRRVMEQAVGLLQRAMGKAVQTLVKNLDAAKASDQIKAATSILDHAQKGDEAGALLEEVQELKRLWEERSQS